MFIKKRTRFFTHSTRFVLLFSFLSPCFANTVIDFADRLFAVGDYDGAIIEYKRYIFFHPTGNKYALAHHKISIAYREQGDWEKSLEALNKATALSENDLQRKKWELDKAVLSMASGNFSLAIQQLLTIHLFTRNTEIKKHSHLLLIYSYIYNHSWHYADQYWSSYRTNYAIGDGNEVQYIEMLFNQGKALPYKSPKLAKYLSMVLPGVGQLYATNWANGFNAIAVNGSFALLSWDLIKSEKYVDGGVVLLFLFFRYYLGNLYQAEQSAIKYNRNLNQTQEQKLLDQLPKVMMGSAKE